MRPISSMSFQSLDLDVSTPCLYILQREKVTTDIGLSWAVSSKLWALQIWGYQNVLVANWSPLWALHILALKMVLVGLGLHDVGISSFVILIISAITSFASILVALLVDFVIIYFCLDRKQEKRPRGCRGGICWHQANYCKINVKDIEDRFSLCMEPSSLLIWSARWVQ